MKTPESWARVHANTGLFADAAERSYVDFLTLDKLIAKTTALGPHRGELAYSRTIAAAQTVVFAGMCLEAAIYEYAALHLGDSYVREHLDRLDMPSKWVICLRLVAEHDLAKDREPYAALRKVVTARNRLVHSKSRPLSEPVGRKELLDSDESTARDVHNAYRAVVLMSFELERILGRAHWPLPSFDEGIGLPQRSPSLKAIIDNCRQLVFPARG